MSAEILDVVGRNLSLEEAACYLGCTPGTLRVWISKRKVPFLKVGRLTKFRRGDLDKWLDSRSVPEVTDFSKGT